ncbi:MAG: flavodoxin family protein [Desulfovibrionaceae bacterium]|nr:flavodoxin family protein [Desulfovibrionaceae bacterium]
MLLGIEASPRKNGNSHILLQNILLGAGETGMDCREAHLRDYRYEPCAGCERCRKDKTCTRFQDGMTLLYPLVEQARALVLVSPVHNYNVTAWMKAFLDRLYCFYDFQDTRPRAWSSRLANQNRKAVIAAIAEQADPKDLGITLDAMRLPLEALGYEILAELPVLRLFDRGHIAQHPDILEHAQSLGRQLAAATAE